MKEPKYDVMIVIKGKDLNLRGDIPLQGVSMNQALKEAKRQADCINYMAGKATVRSINIKFTRIK